MKMVTCILFLEQEASDLLTNLEVTSPHSAGAVALIAAESMAVGLAWQAAQPTVSLMSGLPSTEGGGTYASTSCMP